MRRGYIPPLRGINQRRVHHKERKVELHLAHSTQDSNDEASSNSSSCRTNEVVSQTFLSIRWKSTSIPRVL